jgi:hypothetical protein
MRIPCDDPLLRPRPVVATPRRATSRIRFGRQALQPPAQGGPPRGEVDDGRQPYDSPAETRLSIVSTRCSRRARPLDQALYFRQCSAHARGFART